MLFKKGNTATSVTEVNLSKDYSFMHENFVVSSQHKLFLLLEQTENIIDALEFDSLIYKYGYHNDEVRHPRSEYGLGFYGLFQGINSPWVEELINSNQQHHRHSNSSFDNYKHYIAKFKDVTLEVVFTNMKEIRLKKSELLTFLNEQIKYLEK